MDIDVFSNKNWWLKINSCILVIICMCYYSVCKGRVTEVLIEDCIKNPSVYDNQKVTLYNGQVVADYKEYILYRHQDKIYKITGVSMPVSKENVDLHVIFKKDHSLIFQSRRNSYKFKPIYKDLISLLALFITVVHFLCKYKINPGKDGFFSRRKK